MIRNWLEALGEAGGADLDTAPPAMIQVWTMPGRYGVRADDDPLGQMNQVLDQAGYTSVVATNCTRPTSATSRSASSCPSGPGS